MIRFEQLKKISEKPWFYPVALFLIGFVTYEYALPTLGFTWDDWEIVMFTKLSHSLQASFYVHDRPFPWTYQLTYFLVGSNPIGWHIITFLYRWAGVLIFVRFLALLWPRYEAHLRWLGALMIVYPGFLQQSQAATKDRHIATFFLFAVSLYLMGLAVKNPNWARILFPLSWLATFAHLFTTEYFSGLELLRPFLLWLFVAHSDEQIIHSIRRVAIKYFPYLLVTAFYFWCRFILFPALFHTTGRFGDIKTALGGFDTAFFATALAWFNRALSDLIYLTLRVWLSSIFNFEHFTFQSRITWLAFGLGILLTSIFAFFQDAKEQAAPGNPSLLSIFMVGFLSFGMGALPIWAIGRQISAGTWSDRFALAPLLGASLMTLALLLWLVRPPAQKFVLGVLLVFSIATQVWAVNVYRLDWRTQREYYWQLYWRAPALQTGTAIFSFEQPSVSVTDYADAGYALNVLYHYQAKDYGNYGLLPYWFFRSFGFDPIPGIPLRNQIRDLEFQGNTSDAISVFHQTESSCLMVLDPVYANNPLFELGQDTLIPISNLSRIIPDPSAAAPDPDIFGPEPAHDWCYYFEKADLARQLKDWKTVISLYQEAKQKGLGPGFGAEYIPFIEAYIRTGDWQAAYDLTLAAQKPGSGLKKMLCANWARLRNIPSPDTKVIKKVKQAFACSNF